MAQCSIHRGVISAAREVMNEGIVNDDPTKTSHVLWPEPCHFPPLIAFRKGARKWRDRLAEVRSSGRTSPKCTSAMKAGIVLLALVAMGCAVQSEGKAHLLVQKETMPNSGYAGKDLPIRYRIFNVGDS